MQDPEVVKSVESLKSLIKDVDEICMSLREKDVKVSMDWSTSLTDSYVIKVGYISQRVEYDDRKKVGIKERLTGIVDD